MATATLAGTGNLSANTQAVVAASLLLSGSGNLIAFGAMRTLIGATFVGVGALDLNAFPFRINLASAALAGNSRICAFATVLLGTRGIVHNVVRQGPGVVNNAVA